MSKYYLSQSEEEWKKRCNEIILEKQILSDELSSMETRLETYEKVLFFE